MDEDTTGPSALMSPLGRARLDDLLEELLERVGEVLDTQDRLRGLLDAVVGIASDLSLGSVLQRIVTVATQLAGARYGALGVLGPGNEPMLSEFVTHGLDDEARARIGDLPRGHGLLGVIIKEPRPLRLPNIGDDARSYGFPPGHPPMGTFLGVPVRIRDKVFGNLYLTEKQGAPDFTEEDEEVVIALAAAAGVVIENARLYDEAARRQRWLEASAEVAATVMGALPSPDGLELVLDRACQIACCDVGIALRRSVGGSYVVEAVRGAPAGDMVGSSGPLGESLAGVAMAGIEAVVVDDLAEDPRRARDLLPRGWPDLGPVLMLPLRSGEGSDGLLVLGWDRAHEAAFREVDVRLPAAYAEQAALALQLTRAREAQARLAVFEDRDRIGRDLHDVVIQRLFAVGLSLEATAGQSGHPDVSRRIGTAVDDLDATIRDIRHTIFELQSTRETGDLRSMVASTLSDVTQTLGFPPSLTTHGPIDSLVPDHIRPHLLAVLREALANVARHASASSAQVHLDVADNVTLTVRDDGVGIGETTRTSGLRNMAERAAELGGSFEVAPGASGGTVLRWQVPLRPVPHPSPADRSSADPETSPG